ncbi:MAG: GNAT family N-acetyltransferase [Chitinophagales bacterium]
MRLTFGGIVLKRLDIADLELLRNWRNDAHIADHMFFQEYITPQMQKKWFISLAENDYYFIIQHKHISIGLIHLSHHNEDEKSAEAGLFIHKKEYWGTHLPVLSSLALLQFAFETEKLEKIYAKVKKENNAAMQYNHALGFQNMSDEKLVLDVGNYQKTTTLLMQKIK